MSFALTDDGVRLYWTSEGPEDGPAIVLVRGLGRSHRYFEPIVSPLVNRGFRVLRFDNRGAGQSDTPRGPYRAERMGRDVLCVLDAAGLDRAVVLGMSLGGMIALEAARLAPSRVHGLVLGSVTPRGRGSVRLPLWPQFCLFVSAVLPKVLARRIQAFVTISDGFRMHADALFDRWDGYAAKEPFTFRGLLSHLAAIRSHDSVDWAPRVHCPTLVLAGRQDRLVPWRNAIVLEELMPDAQAVVWDDVGHNMETEQPQRMAATIERWQGRTGGAGAFSSDEPSGGVRADHRGLAAPDGTGDR